MPYLHLSQVLECLVAMLPEDLAENSESLMIVTDQSSKVLSPANLRLCPLKGITISPS